jgi:HEAT repeat protein
MRILDNMVLIGVSLAIYGIFNLFIVLFVNIFSEFPLIIDTSFFYTIGLFFLILGLIIFLFGFLRRIIDIYKLKKQNFVEIVRALGNIGQNSDAVANILQAALKDSNAKVRREAALSLGKIGPCANIAIPSLINSLQDKNPDVRWRASETLGLLGVKSDEIIGSLEALIHDECDYVCESAILALDNLTE